jgi:site-specific recombinase XerD
MKHPLTINDIARALAASKGETNAIVEVLYASGARVSELCKLTWADVNLEVATIRLRGKKGDERCVPIGQPCLTALHALRDAPQGHPRGEARDDLYARSNGPDPSFTPIADAANMNLTSPRNTGPVFSLNEQQVRDRLKTLGRRVGVHLTPHLFRHAFAGHLHLNGANERVIQEWLGHRRVDTTMIYLDGCERAIEEKHQLITRALARARGKDEDPRALRYTTGGLVLR